MVEQITTKIMTGGINKYAKIYGLEPKQVQIRVAKNVYSQELVYTVCANWNPKEVVSFKDILKKKIDILNYESLATPVLIKSLDLYEKEFNLNPEESSVILFLNEKKIYLSVYKQTKSVKLVSLSKHFECMGM